MEIKLNSDFCVMSTDIRNINNREMRQMFELKNRVDDVLNSHKPEAKEKKYISDDDLKLMKAILRVFTREYSSTQTSAFDDELKVIDEEEAEEKHAEKTPTPQEEDAE